MFKNKRIKMKNWIKIVLIITIFIVYIISINIFASLISYSYINPKTTEKIEGGSVVEISVGESMSVQVTRPRWYGTIYENNGNSYLHLFDFIILPKKIKNYNFIWFHLIFLIILISLTFLIFTKKSYKEENLKNEKLGEDSDNFGHLLPSNDN